MRNKLMLLLGLFSTSVAFAETPKALTVPMYETAKQGVGKFIGNVTISETPYGLLFTPNLKGLSPGLHGFHIHQNPSCADNGMAAGGHLDPEKTARHEGPYGKGHLGDLPVLPVLCDGTATTSELAPRLKSLSEVKGHSLMIHEGGDNYSDQPKPLGGGGGRMVCGVIS
ncbi:MAG: sodC [Gammaproteobacteria bacterium]|jgi:Cu-Zn family superoxide dismutase|nr:sodC [Gammaproteobacteria bacterium]